MKARRGSALILVLLMTLAIAGLSIAAIFMASSAGLLSAFYDREREYRLAAETGLALAQARLARDPALGVPDTGMRQLLAGATITRADGSTVPNVRVNVYAASTGDTAGTGRRVISLVAAAYDGAGTRHVRRMDLARRPLSSFALFVDSFPSGVSHGPGTVLGRVHTNANWVHASGTNRFVDTLSAAGTITGSATYVLGSRSGTPRLAFPRDSTFPRLDTLAGAGNLRFTPVSGSGRGSRLEFVAVDADADGRLEPDEGFVRVFDLAAASGVDTMRLRTAAPAANGFNLTALSWQDYYRWDDEVIQNQCGAFYLRHGQWMFFPVSVHRSGWARAVLQRTGAGNYPEVTSGTMEDMEEWDLDAVRLVLRQPTARCFPAGSPYLMLAERKTNPAGVVTGTAADSVPFGVITPPGGWPTWAPQGYGGMDSTFTPRVRTCRITDTSSGLCSFASIRDLGAWRIFPGTAPTGISTSVRQAVEHPYLWPLDPARNAGSRRVVSSTAGPLHVSGTVAGPVSLRVAGRVLLVDRLTYANDPADPGATPCADQLGILASGDILVVAGLTSRVRRIGAPGSTYTWVLASQFTAPLGGDRRFALYGSFLSTTGRVGVESPDQIMGDAGAQLPCPDDGGSGTLSNGGCLTFGGGVAMRTYAGLQGSTTGSGFRYAGVADRCAAAGGRPPFYPVTNQLVPVRTVEIAVSRANTPARIRSLLTSLRGKPL